MHHTKDFSSWIMMPLDNMANKQGNMGFLLENRFKKIGRNIKDGFRWMTEIFNNVIFLPSGSE